MNFNVEERYNAVVITLKGNVMGGPDGQKLRNYLHELKDEGKLNVIVDLSKTKLMNSSGLAMLIAGMATMRGAGGDLRLANVAKKVESLLIMTKLITVFKHYESVDAAAQSYEEG